MQSGKEKFGGTSSMGHLLNASKMAFLPETLPNKVDEQPPKRNRNRKINSCKFCYKRHMKCNKERPMCNVCRERDAVACEYFDEHEKPSISSPGISKNKQNAKKKDIYKQHLADKIFLADTGYSHIKDLKILPNPLTANPTFTVKHGRILFFGPTCFRSSLAKMVAEFTVLHHLFKVWNVFKSETTGVRKSLDFSLAQESKLLDEGINEQLHFADIINVIPKTKKELKYYISLYFKSPLHDSINFISEETVMRNIDEVFLVKPGTDTIYKIGYTNKRNYYKAGIVLYLLGLTYYNARYPDVIVSFFIFLQGQTTGKLMFIEKLQFLVIKCLFTVLNGFTGGDFSHVVNLIGTMCSCLVEFQLNKLNVVRIYESDESLNEVKVALGGDYRLLSNLFYIGMFLDVVCAYQNGKPLFIGFDLYPNEWLLLDDINQKSDTTEKEMYYKQDLKSMKRFLYYSRALISEIYKPVGVPKINKHVDNLILFLHNDLNIIEMCYTDTIPSDEYLLQQKVFESFLASFGTDLLLSVLSMKKDYRYDDQMTDKLSDKTFRVVCNQIILYSLIICQIEIYLTKCIHKRQLLFEEKYKDLMLENNAKTLGCDKVLFYMLFAPRYCSAMRFFLEFFKVLFSIPLSDPSIEGTLEYMDELAKEEQMFLKTNIPIVFSETKQRNSEGLREFVHNTDLKQEIIIKFNGVSGAEEYHLSKIYKKFHPQMFMSVDEDMSKFKFTSLQLYGWFVNLYNEQDDLDRMFKDQTEQLKLQVTQLQAKQNFARKGFSLFLTQIINEKTKRGERCKSSLLKKSFTIPKADSNVSDETPVSNHNTQNTSSTRTSSTVNATPVVNPINGSPRNNSFPFMPKTPGVSSPVGDFSQIPGGLLNNTYASPFFGWDMNFIDFSSKTNWFLDPSPPQPSFDDSEINFMVQTPKPDENNNKNQEVNIIKK